MWNSFLCWVSQNDSVVIALGTIGAVITSSISIFFASFSLSQKKHHDRLSVSPIPRIGMGDYQNKQFVSIENNGVGPLIISSLHILKDGKRLESRLIDNMPQLPNGLYWTTFTGNVARRSIFPGNSITLIEIYGDEDNGTYGLFRDKLREVLSNLTLRLEYTDIYGSKFPPEVTSLKWFGRHGASKSETGKSLTGGKAT